MKADAGIMRAGNADAGEPGRLQQVAVLRLGQGAADAADPLFCLGPLTWVDAFVGGNVADAQSAAGAQNPERLGEDACLIGGQVDDAVGDDHVDLLVGQRDVLDMAVQEAGVGDSRLRCASTGEGEHVGAGVQAVGGADGADSAGGEQDVQAAAGTEIQDSLARLEDGHRQGITAAQTGAQRRLRDAVGVGVSGCAEAPFRERAGITIGGRAAGQGGAGKAGIAVHDLVSRAAGVRSVVSSHWRAPHVG